MNDKTKNSDVYDKRFWESLEKQEYATYLDATEKLVDLTNEKRSASEAADRYLKQKRSIVINFSMEELYKIQYMASTQKLSTKSFIRQVICQAIEKNF